MAKRDHWTPEKLAELEKRIDSLELVCGIDEVGRGPIAGPVTACAIIMPKQSRIDGVRDSKKLSEKKREALYDRILGEAVAWGIGFVDEKTIDAINIRQATLLAMKNALESVADRDGNRVVPELVIVDAETVDTDIPQVSVIKGDDRVYAVSCASIVAKVARDRRMRELGALYPEYGFEKHKGYGTAAHYAALRKYGLLAAHRRSFIHGDDIHERQESEPLLGDEGEKSR